jgi:hypothetical protein
MNARKFTYIIFWTIVAGIIGLFVLIIFLSLPERNGFDLDLDTPRIFKTLLPFITTYMGIVTVFITRNRKNIGPARRQLSANYMAYTSILLLFHFAALISLLLLTAYNHLHLDQFLWIAAVEETIFGACLVLVIRDLFHVAKGPVTKPGNPSLD